MYKVSVKILPRPEVLDTQGRAVEMTLKNKGFDVDKCRVGRYVTFELPTKDEEQARKVAQDVLCNELIESFEIEEIQ